MLGLQFSPISLHPWSYSSPSSPQTFSLSKMVIYNDQETSLARMNTLNFEDCWKMGWERGESYSATWTDSLKIIFPLAMQECEEVIFFLTHPREILNGSRMLFPVVVQNDINMIIILNRMTTLTISNIVTT